MHALVWLIDFAFQAVILLILAHVALSWLAAFNIINLRNPLARQIWDMVERLTEPMLSPIRRRLPQMSGIDFSPMILLVGVYFLRTLLIADILPALVR